MSSADVGTTPEQDPTGAPEGEAAPVDEPHRTVVDALTAELGDGVVGSEARDGDAWVRVRPSSWRRTAEVCRHSLGFDYFCFLSAIDWMPATAPNPEEAAEMGDVGDSGEEESRSETEAAATETDEAAGGEGEAEGWQTGYAGGETRFQALARLYSTSRHLGITLKADLDDEDPRIESWTPVYPGADWHERETWEMYGVAFEGHPNLTHLYLPGEFEGFPLRKDYPLLSRELKPWPGLVDVEPMPEEAEAEADAALSGDGSGGEATS